MPHKLPFVLVFALVLILAPAQAQMPLPSSYGSLECEKVAKDFQREYGGSLILIFPKENDNIVLGDYSGLFINKLFIDNKYYYIDYKEQRIFTSLDAVKQFYTYNWIFDDGNRYSDIAIYDLEEGRPPFNIKWHY